MSDENQMEGQPGTRLCEPRVGQRAKILVPERKTPSGRRIPVVRPGTPRREYQSGEVVTWDDHHVFLRQEGALLAAEVIDV